MVKHNEEEEEEENGTNEYYYKNLKVSISVCNDQEEIKSSKVIQTFH